MKVPLPMKKLYIVRVNSDQTEGRGRMEPAAYLLTRDAAEAVRKQLDGPMPYFPSDIVEVEVYESLADYKSGTLRATAARALAKLTPDERAALGLAGS